MTPDVTSANGCPISAAELEELRHIVYSWHLINYESEDPCDEIDPVSYVAPDGDTCLHSAAFRGELRAVELLVKAGLDVNRPGDMEMTPLHCADTPEIVAFLLANGARTDIVNLFGRSPLGGHDR
jgi:ankyrin repeat protein